MQVICRQNLSVVGKSHFMVLSLLSKSILF